jgi:KUP system potassium uptake protein
MLPQVIVFLHVKSYPIPHVKDSHRFTKTQIGENMYQITARYGFKEQVNVPHMIKLAGFCVDGSVPESVELPEISSKEVLPILAAHVAYYVPGYVLKVDKTQWFYRRLLSAIYIFMRVNSMSQYSAWKIPTDLTIELGTIMHLK